jgi:hypothetical protein
LKFKGKSAQVGGTGIHSSIVTLQALFVFRIHDRKPHRSGFSRHSQGNPRVLFEVTS